MVHSIPLSKISLRCSIILGVVPSDVPPICHRAGSWGAIDLIDYDTALVYVSLNNKINLEENFEDSR